MGWIFTLCSISFVALHYIKEKNLYSPGFLLTLFWAVLSFFSNLCLYGMYRASDQAFIVALVSMILFSIGVLISSNKRLVIGNNKKETQYLFLLRRFRILVILMIVYCAYRFSIIIPLLKSGYSLDVIRMSYFGAEVYGTQISSWVSIFEIYVHLPVLYAAMGMCALNITKRKEEKFIDNFSSLLCIVWIVMAQIMMGGRIVIFIFGLESLIAFFINNKMSFSRLITLDKRVFKILGLCLCVVIALYFLSINRTESQTYEFFKSFYVDMVGAFTHMGIRLEEFDTSNYTWGVSLLSGILRPVMLIWKYLVGAYPEIYNITINIGSFLQTPVMIGQNIEMNAYVLPAYYFYYDFGYIGVVFDSLICGCFCELIYTYRKNRNSVMWDCIYMLIVYAILTSMIRYAGNLVYYVLAFAVVRMLFKKY